MNTEFIGDDAPKELIKAIQQELIKAIQQEGK